MLCSVFTRINRPVLLKYAMECGLPCIHTLARTKIHLLSCALILRLKKKILVQVSKKVQRPHSQLEQKLPAPCAACGIVLLSAGLGKSGLQPMAWQAVG